MPLKNFTDLVSFARASDGWYYSAAGTLTKASLNEPRVDYDPLTKALRGLLVEEQRTNVLLYSQDQSNAAWTKFNSVATPGAALGIDGAMSATALTETTTNAAHAFGQTCAKTGAVQTWTATFILKAAGRRYARVLIGNGGLTSYAHAYFDLQAGNITIAGLTLGTFVNPVSRIVKVANGYYACSLTADTDADATVAAWVYAAGAGDGSLTSYAGDGSVGLYVAGTQVEAGAFSTSFIPTTAAQVTRAAESPQISTAPGWFQSGEGTLFAEFVAPNFIGAAQLPGVAGFISPDLVTNNFGIAVSTVTSKAQLFRGVGGVSQGALSTANAATAYITAKVAGAYSTSSNDAICLNGGVVASTPNVGGYGSTDKLRIGRFLSNPGWLNGWLRELRYYPRRLSDAELQSITA